MGWMATHYAGRRVLSHGGVLDGFIGNMVFLPDDGVGLVVLTNTWPGGMRELLCLNCGRAFESDSKAQRLCRRCRVGSDFTLR